MNVPTSPSKPARNLPVLQGILPIARAQVPTDIIAGITLAATRHSRGHGLHQDRRNASRHRPLHDPDSDGPVCPLRLLAPSGRRSRLCHGGHHGRRAGRSCRDRLATVHGLCRGAGAAGRDLSHHRAPDSPGLPRRLLVAHRPDRLSDGRRHSGRHRPDRGHVGHSGGGGSGPVRTAHHRLPAARPDQPIYAGHLHCRAGRLSSAPGESTRRFPAR